MRSRRGVLPARNVVSNGIAGNSLSAARTGRQVMNARRPPLAASAGAQRVVATMRRSSQRCQVRDDVLDVLRTSARACRRIARRRGRVPRPCSSSASRVAGLMRRLSATRNRSCGTLRRAPTPASDGPTSPEKRTAGSGTAWHNTQLADSRARSACVHAPRRLRLRRAASGMPSATTRYDGIASAALASPVPIASAAAATSARRCRAIEMPAIANAHAFASVSR